MAIALLASPDELHFIFFSFLTELHLCRPEVTEHGQMGTLTYPPFQFLCQRNATAYDNDVDIIGRTLEEDITDIASHYIAFQPQMVCGFANLMKDVLVEYQRQFFVGVQFHAFISF